MDRRMLVVAERLAADEGVTVGWCESPAEATNLPSAAFDSVVAGQSWHWFDGEAAIAEARRILAPPAGWPSVDSTGYRCPTPSRG